MQERKEREALECLYPDGEVRSSWSMRCNTYAYDIEGDLAFSEFRSMEPMESVDLRQRENGLGGQLGESKVDSQHSRVGHLQMQSQAAERTADSLRLIPGLFVDSNQNFSYVNCSLRYNAPSVTPPLPPHTWQPGLESSEAMTNREIVAEAVSKSRFLRLLENYRTTGQTLNAFNVCTILQRTGRLRLCLPKNIVVYLVAVLNEPNCRDEELKARQIANALSGFSCLENSDETRQLMSELTLRVVECREVLKPQDISQAEKGLEQMRDSEERERLVEALAANKERGLRKKVEGL